MYVRFGNVSDQRLSAVVVDLALKDEELVAESEDLGVASVSEGEEQADSGQDRAAERSEHRHSRPTLAITSVC